VGKILFWLVIIIAVLMLARIAARASAGRRNGPAAGGPTGGRPPLATEQMVRCAQCGVHLPRSEATLAAGELFCSAEHARLGSRQH